VDNDPGVQFELNRYSIRENEGSLTVKVLRGNDVDLPPFTVDYATSNLTAVAGEDYAETSGTLAFAEGERFKTLSVPILWNETSELDRQFKLTLSNPSGGLVLGAKQTATIVVLDMTGMEAHRFDGVAVLSDLSVQLNLGGGVHKRFKDYFDLYPIEVSNNLLDWEPLVTVQRTNSSTNVLVYMDPTAATSSQRFYRTVTNHLITPVTKPTGPFPVGVVSRMLTDPSRRNRYHVSTNGSFMISLWYPAVAEAGKLPDRLEDQQLALDPGWPAAWDATPLPDREPYFVSHALAEAPCASAQAPYPVLIYSHGAYDGRTTIMERAPEIASHGYVVVGVNHWDAFGTVFPDGSYLHGENAGTFVITTAGFQDRVTDLRFVLDQLEEWNRADAMFAGRLDLTNVATMGYSWGGGVAGEVARVDERCKAAIVLEGYFQNADDLVRLGLTKPTLSIYADPIGIPGQELLLFNKVTHDATWFQISSTTHLRFVDYYWFGSSAQIPGFREAARTMNAYTLWFLNKYLKGGQDPMPARADYPRVINFKQK
jgi:dienelactone hydrolase